MGGVPALYVAWLAVPGVISPPEAPAACIPTSGRPVPRWDPVELDAHQVMACDEDSCRILSQSAQRSKPSGEPAGSGAAGWRCRRPDRRARADAVPDRL